MNPVTDPKEGIYESNNYVVLDFETTVHSKGSALDPRNSLVLAVWECGADHPSHSETDLREGGVGRRELGPDAVRTVRWGTEFDMDELVRDIERADYVVAHNAKFELQWLERCGLNLEGVTVWDTMIAEYVRGGNRWTWSQLSLESCAKRNFKDGKVSVISAMYKAGLCSTEIPASWLERYCKQDVTLTHRLMLEQRNVLRTRDLLPVLYTRCILTPVLADIEKNGMMLDEAQVLDKKAEAEVKIAQLQKELDQVTGGINLNSTKQLRAYLYQTLKFKEVMTKKGGQWVPDRTASDMEKADAQTLQRLKAETAEQRQFLELYREYKSVWNELTKYLRKFAECVEDSRGLLRAQFNQTNTQTHRLSSSGRDYATQFQNFPRAYKPLFRSRGEGWLVGECDGAQLEFRVAVHLGRDAVGLQDIVDGTDIHSVTADVIGVSRQDAKAHTFKPLYGGQSGTDDEKRYYQFFRDKYTGIADTQQHWIDEVLETGSLRTEWGMRYHWPNTTMDRSGYVKNTTSICNYPVQAFATAEIIPVALTSFWHRIKEEGLRMMIVNTVHDSIIVELPEEEVDDFHRLARQCLIEDVYPYLEQVYGVKLTVPLGCGVMTGSHWGSKDETVYNAEEKLYG
jgi:DNA polymerase I-like protein with 3'-5' exonuclease and polymerase domains